MNIIKVRFIGEDNTPYGGEYSYYSEEKVEIGDVVYIDTPYDNDSKAIVTTTDVHEEEVESFKDKMKTIKGVVEYETDKDK